METAATIHRQPHFLVSAAMRFHSALVNRNEEHRLARSHRRRHHRAIRLRHEFRSPAAPRTAPARWRAPAGPHRIQHAGELRHHLGQSHERRELEIWSRLDSDAPWRRELVTTGEVAELSAISVRLDVDAIYDEAAEPAPT